MPLGIVPRSQAQHIQINAGNVLTVTLLAVLGVGVAGWASSWIARTEIPILSQLAVGAQVYLKGF
jgi:hypothetical protein